MIVYKFEKSRMWVQVLNDETWRSMPFGHVCLNEINTMRSGSDFDMFKKMYANQISPFMMSGYSTEYGKKAAAEIADTLKDEKKMKDMFESLNACYACVEDFIEYLCSNLPHIHLYREKRKNELQTVYDSAYDVAFRFYAKIDAEQLKDYIETDYKKYRNTVFDYIHYDGIKLCKGEYTGGVEEMAVKYRVEIEYSHYSHDTMSEWCMFPLDFAELLFNQDINFIVKECSHCGALYPTSYPQSVFCDSCRSNNVPNTTRKNNKCRQLHKNILDLLNNCANPKTISRYAGLVAPDNTITYYFRNESNFYWALCQGKKPKTEKLVFYDDISTEKQYYEWLEKIHLEIKTTK